MPAPHTTGTSLNDIRRAYLDYFAAEGHAVVPSAPLVPQNDPSLLFVNAGMAPFKNVFTGAEQRPASRATSSQKCVRAGGKHNDLDNVGYTARHHTFFEMLGNFSFGDYFKEEAISLAWKLVTGEFGLPADKLLVTVYAEDDEAHGLWRKIAGLSDDRIIRIPTSDNFWSMGDTGPCGPCSEIFYDHGEMIPGGPPGSVDEDGDRFIEIWNLVFMQYEQFAGDRGREALPRPSIDTGMGLERIAAVLQGVHDNYDVDLFHALIAASVELTCVAAEGEAKFSHRVIADHLRASSFLVADGVSPSNEGRGYVLRRIMRRAMRHAHLLGAVQPLMWRLVPALVEQMGRAYPELVRATPLITETLRQEEERFRTTLGRGMGLLEEATSGLGSGGMLSGETAFKLYDTYGFPLDLTQDAVRARGITVDLEGFDAAMDRQKAMAREAWSGSGDRAQTAEWFKLRDRLGPTDFCGYEQDYSQWDLSCQVVAIVREADELDFVTAHGEDGVTVEVLFDRTPFYAESGGQASDIGTISWPGGRGILVGLHKQAGDLFVHTIHIASGTLAVGDGVQLTVDRDARTRTRANHSSAHLVHAALKNVLGGHVAQKGQLVDAERMRFDFSHGQPLTPEQLYRVEAEVNAVIRQNLPARTESMAPAAAIEAGAVALFGEKYGEEVRVLTLGRSLEGDGAYSVELCGGTHVARTGDIALFKIIAETGIASGVRRVEALTGEAARRHLLDRAYVAESLAAQFKVPPSEVIARVEALTADRKRLERELADARRKLALSGGAGGAAWEVEEIGGVRFIGRVLEGVDGRG
ncbi:alanine--tRNA ligase, partial [Caulobacter sp. S45]|uniref:alanine--tRNA ligase n=1 Tax=Caulobacter sp. S45 TaxID=1641861 RepID=UPI001576E8DB